MKKAGDLAARLELLNKKAVQRAKNNPGSPKPPEDNRAAAERKVIQLPLWPEAARGVPNSVLRSVRHREVWAQSLR